jgi:putative ABC transport system substrate-binding protein
VIASDQGSVMQGATVAVGINEEQFGEDAGMLIQKILADKAKNSIGYNHSEHLNLFFNEKRLSYQNILTKDKVCSLSIPCLEEAE